jgi:hypothetical protein
MIWPFSEATIRGFILTSIRDKNVVNVWQMLAENEGSKRDLRKIQDDKLLIILYLYGGADEDRTRDLLTASSVPPL